IYKTQNRWSAYAAVQREVRLSLHERCARAGIAPAATRRSSIPARLRATTKATARACALFRRRNGGGINRGLLSEASGQRSDGPPPTTVGLQERRTSRDE